MDSRLFYFGGHLSRETKKLIMLTFDMVMIPLALWSAFVLRLGEMFPDVSAFWWMFPLAPLLCIPFFVRLGLYRAVIRFMGSHAVFAVLKGVTLSTLLLATLVLLSGVKGVPRSVFLIYWGVAIFTVGGSRFLMRSYFTALTRRRHTEERLAIYGAGASGVQLATALIHSREATPVVFLDDNPSIQGGVIQGIKVYKPSSLRKLIEEYGITQVLLAMPSVSRSRRRAIVDELAHLPVHVRTIPGMVDIISGHSLVDELREVDVEDLLGRDAVTPDKNLLGACISGKSVMVTGAGGSIGSELCRQILYLNPRRLVLFEMSEYALYKIERELCQFAKKDTLEIELVPILGSVQDGRRMEDALRAYEVQTIYHAAAYKHVPLVEHNIVEGVQNNIFGTWRAAEAAINSGVETFVLISTDKAVRPTNIMGASKRFAELVLQSLNQQSITQPDSDEKVEVGVETRFCMVRFGNVLGSSGSVVPLFREQIRRGGPVTVTHPEIIRYFMTIPEAAQLVIQAGSMAKGGDVFVLDMGEPVKIAELAEKMIHLTGLEVKDENNPNGDIEIELTGLRPGEKLYEELLIGDNVTGTQHPRILRAEEVTLPWPKVLEILNKLNVAVNYSNCKMIRTLLQEAVNGYEPKGDIEDFVWNRRKTSEIRDILNETPETPKGNVLRLEWNKEKN